jgi:hypothetical protein
VEAEAGQKSLAEDCLKAVISAYARSDSVSQVNGWCLIPLARFMCGA